MIAAVILQTTFAFDHMQPCYVFLVNDFLNLDACEQHNVSRLKKCETFFKKLSQNSAASRIRTCAGRPHWISSPTP